jgi:hypothetical protein
LSAPSRKLEPKPTDGEEGLVLIDWSPKPLRRECVAQVFDLGIVVDGFVINNNHLFGTHREKTII